MLEDVIKIVAKQLNVSPDIITEDDRIVGDLGADSLDIVELADIFEKMYDRTISDQSIMEIKTIFDIVNYLKNF